MKAQNAGQALGLVMVDELVRSGMTDACLSPGSRSTPMALALAQSPIRLHVSIDERSTGFLALGIAKASRRPVAVLTTSGTATANLLPAIVEAHLSAVPLVVMTADRPPELRDTGAGQTIDQVKLYGDYVRWFCEVGAPEVRQGAAQYWRSVACRAWGHCTQPPPGPVHLNLAFRDPLVPVADEAGFEHGLEGRPDGRPWHEFSSSRVAPSPEDMAAVVEDVRSSKKGVVVVGSAQWDAGIANVGGPGGSLQPGSSPRGIAGAAAAARLAARLGWPLLAEATSGARTAYPAVSTYDALLRHRPFADAHRPDFVLRIGSTGLSQALSQILDESVRQTTVHNASFVPDPRRGSERIVRADPSVFCRDLCESVTFSSEGDWIDSWMRAEAVARAEIDRFLDGECPVNEPALARDLAACLPPGSNLVAASSMPVRDLDWFMRPREGLTLYSNRGANGIDGFVSTVLGVALSSPGYTAALCGDLSLLHDQNGLIIARDEQVDATFVVANNNGGGIFSFLPQAADEKHFERLFGTPHNLDLGALVRALGLRHTLVEGRADVAPAVAHAQEAGGVHIVEAKTDRRANVEIHKALWSGVAKALDEQQRD